MTKYNFPVVTQMVKNLPVSVTQVQSLGPRRSMDKNSRHPTPVFLPGDFMDRRARWAGPEWLQIDTTE